MTAEVKSCEAAIPYGELFRGGMEGGLHDGDSVILEHVKEGGFAGIIETEEEKLGVFVQKAEGGKDVPDWKLERSVSL